VIHDVQIKDDTKQKNFTNLVHMYYLKISVVDHCMAGTEIQTCGSENIDLSGVSLVTSLSLEEEYGET
jgi:hypothetical protein